MKFSNRFALSATAVVVLSSLSTAALAASATGTANANVLQPIAITAVNTLEFGTFAANAAGTVVIPSGGTRSVTGGVIGASGTSRPASFSVTGTGNATFGITYPTGITVVNGANSMAVSFAAVAAGNASTGTLSAGAVTISVGAVLTVAAAQTAALYTGTYPLIVEYN